MKGEGPAVDAPGQPAILSTRLEEQDQFLLHEPREVRRVLHALIDKHSLVTVHLSPGSRMYPTVLVGLAGDEQSLLLDGSRDPAINGAMVRASHVTCVSRLDHVPIHFRLSGLRATRVQGLVTFQAALPEALLYLQRREFHRLQVPVSEPVLCRLAPPETAYYPARRLQAPELRVLDISAGGCLVDLPRDCAHLQVASEVECNLLLPGAAPIPLRLRVCSRYDPPSPGPGRHPHAGCAFRDLPPGAENQIQRYIFRVERHLTARARGEG